MGGGAADIAVDVVLRTVTEMLQELRLLSLCFEKRFRRIIPRHHGSFEAGFSCGNLMPSQTRNSRPQGHRAHVGDAGGLAGTLVVEDNVRRLSQGRFFAWYF